MLFSIFFFFSFVCTHYSYIFYYSTNYIQQTLGNTYTEIEIAHVEFYLSFYTRIIELTLSFLYYGEGERERIFLTSRHWLLKFNPNFHCFCCCLLLLFFFQSFLKFRSYENNNNNNNTLHSKWCDSKFFSNKKNWEKNKWRKL